MCMRVFLKCMASRYDPVSLRGRTASGWVTIGRWEMHGANA